ncbi:glycosyltransferase [Chryseobacterium sp. T20]|uniref:glycosyltransferase n=1 Tax=Chryseobacterium sp. T20 TaxID=3395375 RepID=UPI0039BCC4EB
MIIDFLDRVYSSLRSKENKIESLFRFIIRKLSNLILPLYLNFTKKDSRLHLSDKENIIVSLTTFPGRISKLWMVVECMLRQSLLPNKIVLYLAKDQFPNELKDIPDNLIGYYKKKQLEIRFVDEDLRSHKKYYYAFKEYQNDVIITIDDDIFYPSNIIKDLMDLHEKFPDTICCHRAHKIVRNKDNTISKYSKWKKVFGNFGPAFDLFHTSGGGTLYKTNFFSEEVLNKDAFVSLCFMADDVWLNMMAQLNKTKTVKSNYFSNLIPIENKNSLFKLSQENVADGGNDKQLQNLIQNYNINNYEIFK